MMMSIKKPIPVLLAVCLCTLALQAGAELSEEQAAVVAGSKRTQSLIEEQNYEAALQSAQSTYELSAQTLGANNANTAILAEDYARLLGSTGNRNQAHDHYKKAVEIFTTLYGDKSVKAVPAMLGMAEFSWKEEQAGLVKRALEIQRSQAPEDQLTYADAAVYAGEYLIKQRGNRKLAHNILGDALKIYETEYGEKSTEVIQPLMILGGASIKLGKTRKANYFYGRALSIAQKNLNEAHQAVLLREAGSALLQFGRSTEAEKYLKQAHKMSLKAFGENDFRTALAAISMARYHMADKKPESAETLLKQALSVVEKNSNYRNHQMAVLSLLVESYESRGRREEATPYCQAIGAIAPWSNTQDYLPIFKKAPVYPKKAVRANSEGYVIVEYTVDEYGFVRNPEIVEATGHKSFLLASIQTAEAFRYAPAYVNGKPVATEGVRNKFTFALE